MLLVRDLDLTVALDFEFFAFLGGSAMVIVERKLAYKFMSGAVREIETHDRCTVCPTPFDRTLKLHHRH